MAAATPIILATDSPDPSGVGRHMLALAAALPGGWAPRLLFRDHAAGRGFVALARAAGLDAAVVADDGWAQACAGAALVHVHAGIGWEGHALCATARAQGAAVVRTEHLPWLITCPEQRRAYAGMIAQVDAVIAVSRAAAQGWRRVLAGMAGPRLPLACIPNGIPDPRALARDPAPATPPAPPAAPAAAHPPGPRLLCVARFTPQKNHRVLVGAMARLVRTHPGARLALVGTGPQQDAVRAQVARLGLDCVDFLGPRDDVPELMAAADLVVLASAFEGLPLVVLEAMAIGTPVVATRIGGVVEALGPDHPWLVAPGDRRALAAAMAAALDDPARRARATAAQLARYESFYTATRMGADTARLYAAVLRGRTRTHSMTTTRLGFIGAGGIAHRHFGVLDTMDDVRIVAVADPDQTRAAEAAARFGAACFADAGAMLDAVELDAVYICVPPFAHGDAERACIARGLPFFVEKPLSLDLALAEDIAAEVERAGLITAVGYHWRYLDTVDQARALLADNPAHLITGFWLDQTPPPQWWWREDESGGQIVEQATHLIDLARFLAGDVTEVFGLAARRDRPDFAGLTVPTATTASLRFASGAIANLSATCLLRWNHRVGLHVFADALALEISDHDIMVDVGHGRPVRHAEGDPVWREDRDFVEAVQGRENRIRCPYAEALETHRVALAVARSAQTDAIVKMEVLRANPQPFFRQAAS